MGKIWVEIRALFSLNVPQSSTKIEWRKTYFLISPKIISSPANILGFLQKYLKKMSKFFIVFLCFMLAQAKPNGGGSTSGHSMTMFGGGTNNLSGSVTMTGTAETFINSTKNGKVFF